MLYSVFFRDTFVQDLTNNIMQPQRSSHRTETSGASTSHSNFWHAATAQQKHALEVQAILRGGVFEARDGMGTLKVRCGSICFSLTITGAVDRWSGSI